MKVNLSIYLCSIFLRGVIFYIIENFRKVIDDFANHHIKRLRRSSKDCRHFSWHLIFSNIIFDNL